MCETQQSKAAACADPSAAGRESDRGAVEPSSDLDTDETALDLSEMLTMKRALSAFLHRKHR